MEPSDTHLGILAGLPVDLLCECILPCLSIEDVIRLSCTSQALRVLCLEEPLWMMLCLKHVKGRFVYKGSWRATAIADIAQDRATPPALGAPLPVPGFFCDYLYRRWCRCNMHIAHFLPDAEGVHRVDGQSLTKRTFADGFLHHHEPVMLTGLQTDWPAGTSWQAGSLLDRFGDGHFDITVPYGRVSMTMRNYLDFSERQRDEDPLYLFDADFGSKYPEMLLDYQVPNIFPESLFGVLGKRQPPFRWFVMGPARSGASWHIDPFATSAWNALVSGVKRWALYPPGQKPPGVHVWVDENNDVQWDSPSSLTWFLEVYPTLEPGERPLEVVQHPGEVIFVPGNWWHLVLNLEASVAVTQNFASEEDCDSIVRSLALGSAAGDTTDAEERPVFNSRQGFMRDRILGPFLYQFAARQQPTVQDKIVADGDAMAIRLADAYTARETWLDILRRTAFASTSKEGWLGTQLPIAGGNRVVFKFKDVIYKFATKGGGSAAAETWAEALASVCLQRSATQLTHCTPQVLALGRVDTPDGPTDGPGATHAIPFVAMTACPGVALDTSGATLAPSTRRCIAYRLGRLTAQLHSLPLPDDRLSAASGDAAAPRCHPFAFWQSRAGLDLSFRPSGAQPGCAKALLAHLGLQLQGDATNGTACVQLRKPAGAGSLGSSDKAREAAEECMSDRVAVAQLWRPFADFLRERRRAAPWEMVWEHSMPQRLLEQLDNYLPPDPAAFLPGSFVETAGSAAACKANSGCSDGEHTTGNAGGSGGDEGSTPPPSWVHGDLIAQNILVSEQLRGEVLAAGEDGLAHDAVRLIDFGDAGHGDPLYDLVLLLVKTFRCEVHLWEACLSAARQELGGRPWWLHARGGVPLSRVAMTYTLLHEQDLASALFKALPDLWRLRTLDAVEQAVFGQLDHL